MAARGPSKERTRHSHVLIVLALCVGLLSAAEAHAQSPEASTAAAAERLFDEGRALMADGKYEAACPRLAESQRLYPGTGTLLNLAECYERTGRDASAWAIYRQAEAAARRQGHRPRTAHAMEGVERTSKKLAYLTIDADGGAPGRVVTHDGKIVGVGSLGVAIPVDAGVHEISATAEGHAPWRTTVTLAAAERLHVQVPALAATPAAQRPDAPSVGPTTGSGQRALGWVVGGVGVVGIGVGLGFGLLAKSKDDEAHRGECSAVSCTSRGGALLDEADTAATVSTLMVAGGAVIAAGGIVLVLTAPSGTAGPTLRASLRGSRLELGGTF
ncbi:MAG TPA: hypothetical protein VLT33_18140 [Labilithrix sp.]|nr:hypothetical protein [Labilithrix sp.]